MPGAPPSRRTSRGRRTSSKRGGSFDETALWYDVVCPILAKHAYPQGHLVAVQVDNEMAYFFNINAYACDFSPASIGGYRAFL
jgi:beta-galactosidase